jgi:hypothetical protein
MAFSFEATHGTTFLFNKGLSGNVTIIRGTEQLSVPGADLLEFLAGQEKGGKTPPYLEPAPRTGKGKEKPR